jgi:ribosomal protein L35AE/L33A
MKAKLIGFKGSRRTQNNQSCILDTDDKNPAGLIGKKVFWKTASGRAIQGKILHTHGKSSLLARFKKGIPGFAVGDELEFKAPSPPKPIKAAKKAEKPKAEVKKPKAPAKEKVAPKKKTPPAKPAAKKAPAKTPAKKVEEKKKPTPKKKTEAKKKTPAKKKPAPKKKAPLKKPATKKKPAKKAAK